AVIFFFIWQTATTEFYPLSLHDALPICDRRCVVRSFAARGLGGYAREPPPSVRREQTRDRDRDEGGAAGNEERQVGAVSVTELRSEEHTSELQSRFDLVCRLLLEKKNDE